jgi:hypothetical protein
MLWGIPATRDDAPELRGAIVEVLVHEVLEQLFATGRRELARRELEDALGELGGAFILFELALSNGLPRGLA